METKTVFAKFIAEKRIAAGLTQRELAQKLYLSDTTISKWERGLSYPDITLIAKICEELNMTEHEFVTASDDFTFRAEKIQARRYRGMVKAYQIGMSASYGVALLTCFICNLAIQHTLSWFFVVLMSLALAFTLTVLPTLLRQHKALISLGSSAVLLYLLLAVCCLYVGGHWFWNLAVPVTSVSIGFVALLVWVIGTRHLNWILKVGVTSLLLGLFTLLINPWIDWLMGHDLSSYQGYFQFWHWQGANCSNQIVVSAFALVGMIGVAAGVVFAIRQRQKSRV